MNADPPGMLRRRAFWLLLPLVWILSALVGSSRAGMLIRPDGKLEPIAWTDRFIESLLVFGVWAIVTPFIVVTVRRIARSRLSPAVAALAHLAAAAVFIGVEFVLHAVLAPLTTRFAIALTWGGLRSLLPQSIGLYTLIVVGTIAWLVHERAARHERDLSNARLQILRAQLHPHFLFNALHAVSALIDWRPQEARTMLVRLSELLRQAVELSEATEVPLTREIEWIEQYIEVQQIRYEERLAAEVAIAEDAFTALVPPLVLQPLVENAIKHGVERRPGGGRIEINAERDGNALLLRVIDDGPGLGPSAESGSGVGLRNTRDRLAAIYGPETSVTLRPTSQGGTEAAVRIPFRAA